MNRVSAAPNLTEPGICILSPGFSRISHPGCPDLHRNSNCRQRGAVARRGGNQVIRWPGGSKDAEGRDAGGDNMVLREQ